MPSIESAAAPIGTPGVGALSILQSSNVIAFNAYNVMITSEPGGGKTVTAATASRKCPPRAELGKVPVVLDDIAIATNELGGLAALATMKITVPHAIDMLALLAKGDILSARRQLIEVAKLLPTIGVHTLIYDTLSTDDYSLMTYASRPEMRPYFMSKGGSFDRFALFRWIQEQHQDFYEKLRATGLNLVFLAHLNVVSAEAEAQPRNAARGLRPGDLVPKIGGSAQAQYMAQCEVLSLVNETDAKTGAQSRYLLVEDYGNRFTKSRWKNVLDAREPADLNHILNKVRAAVTT